VPAIEAMANVKKQNRANLTEEKSSHILFFFFFILLQIKKILTDVLLKKIRA
jgi:phosphoribosyl-ATP pyrophosphohydrolase